MPPPVRSFRPDFRTIYNNLPRHKRHGNTVTMDGIYETITKIVDDQSLDEADTASLVKKSVLGAELPEKCYKVIMRAIWPSHSTACFIIIKKAKTTDPVPNSDPKPETLVEEVKRAVGVNSTNSADDKIFQVIDSQFTMALNDNTLIVEKEGRAILALRGQLCGQLPTHPGGPHNAKQNATTENSPDGPINTDAANNATQIPPSGDPSTPDSPGLSISRLPQPSSSGSIDNKAAQTPPSGDSSSPSPPSSSTSLPQSSSSGSIDNNATQTPPSGNSSASGPPGSSTSYFPSSAQHILPVPGTGNHQGRGRGQTALRGQGRGSPRGGGPAFTLAPANHQFTQRINDFPMPSGRHLQRTYAFTELSAPGASTIILGPLPPPTLPPHVRLSTLPPGHPPQSYGPGAFPPNHKVPGTSPSNSNSGTTSGITEKAASTSRTQPVVSDQSPAPRENLKKRSRNDEDDEEETSRPSIRLRIEAPSQASHSDDTNTHAAPVASSSTFAPSDNNEGSSNGNSSHKKRTRDAEEDEEETARPSTRMRQELPVVRPRHPSPTPSDRRIGRIIAPFGTSIRFNPRPAPEADIGSLEAAHNETNSQDNLSASSSGSSSSGSSSSGSSTLPLASSDAPSANRSSKRLKKQRGKGKEANKE